LVAEKLVLWARLETTGIKEQMTDDRGQRTEVRKQMADDRGQRTDVRRQVTDDRIYFFDTANSVSIIIRL